MIKNNLKKFTAIAIVFTMTFSMVGCEKDKNSKSAIVQHESVSTQLDATEETNINLTEQAENDSSIKEQEEFDVYLQESFEEAVTNDTITFHSSLAHPEKYGITMNEVTLGEFDLSEEGLAQDKKQLEEDIKELEGFDYELLTEDQQLTYDIMYNWLNTELLSYDNPYFYEPFAYTSGLQTNLPITMSDYKFYDENDVKDYIELLNLFPDYFQKCLDFEKTKSEKGYFMSDANADEVIRQCEEYIADPENNLLIATFNNRIDDVPDITPEKIEEYKKQNYDAVMNSVIPSYENVINTFTSLKGTCTNDMGLAHYEGGKEYYEYLLKKVAGTDKTPEEIIELLDSEIAVIYEELKEMYDNKDFGDNEVEIIPITLPDGSDGEMLGIALTSSATDQSISYEEKMTTLEEIYEDKLPEMSEVSYTISPVHESLEDSVSPAYFMVPALDDYKNNYIYINQSFGNTDASVLAHEGIPGHMYQFTYFLSKEPEPIRYLITPMGYIEGWATYVEHMTYGYWDEYKGENCLRLNYVQSKLNLLMIARMDIAINYEGWSRDDVYEYTSGYDDFVDISGYYDYLTAEPGNYQMYVTGWLEIEELKEYAQEELKDQFDEVEFHKVVLDAGPCQFSILEDIVEQYVKENK